MMYLETAESNNTSKTSATGFASLQLVTASCHSILSTNFIAPTPKPDWFDALSADLDNAKVHAREWINDIAPMMTASIPSHVIDYGTTYAAMTDQIVDLLDKNPTARGKDHPVVKQVFELIHALQAELKAIIAKVESVQVRLKIWGDKMQAAHDRLFASASSIQETAIELQAEIEKMNLAIKMLREQIESENKAIAAGAAAIGIGLFALVAGIAFAPVTGGASLIVSGIGALGIIGGGVTWGVMQAKIDSQFKEIAEDMKKIAANQRQIVALQSLSLAANTAISAIATATQALSDVKVMWTVFQNELQGTLDKLEKTDEELSAILNKAWILAAQKEWNMAVDFAQKLATMKVEFESKTVPMAA